MSLMHLIPKLRWVFSKRGKALRDRLILPLAEQAAAWQRADAKMSWGIDKAAFDRIERPTPGSQSEAFVGVGLFYGFGDDGRGNADPVLSGKLAWEYALKGKRKTWRCEYIDFDQSDHIRLRPGAPPRPKGFYFAELDFGEKTVPLTVSGVRKTFEGVTGWGPEGLQLLAVTHPHLLERMNERKMPFAALADYDVAPYGFNDFFDAAQLFCSLDVFGLGIGHVDRNYPMFGIPTLRIL